MEEGSTESATRAARPVPKMPDDKEGEADSADSATQAARPVLMPAAEAPGPRAGMDPLLDRIIDGRYRIRRPLGAGGMGAVYVGEHVQINKTVAIKVLQGPLARDAEFRQRFEHEARAASRLTHATCVSVIDFGCIAQIEPPQGAANLLGALYLVMEYVRGESLAERLKRSRIEPVEAIAIARGVLSALRHAHGLGLVHRDIKPHNIMLCASDDATLAIKLLDFGLAKQVEGNPQDQPVTRFGVMLGTPAYVSPEQAVGEPIDARSDLYSLGVVLFEMVCGKTPFQDCGHGAALMRAHVTLTPPRPRDLEPALSPALEAVILKALEKDRAARHLSAEEFQTALATCPEAKRDSGAQLATSVTPPAAIAAVATATRMPSRPSWWLLGGAGLLLLGGIGLGLTLRGSHQPSPLPAAVPATLGPPAPKTPAHSPRTATKKTAPPSPPSAAAEDTAAPAALAPVKSQAPTAAPESPAAHEPAATAPPPSAPPLAASPPAAPISKAAQRALSLVDQGRDKGAIDAARAALKRNPKDTMARLALGAAYQGHLWCSDAIEEFEKVVREVPALGSEPRLLRSSIICLKSKVQSKVVRFLAKLGQPARGPLENAARSSDPELRQGATRALARLK